MISLIVPIYKVEKYLEKCRESILSQTYNVFDLMLVDHGSTDRYKCFGLYRNICGELFGYNENS